MIAERQQFPCACCVERAAHDRAHNSHVVDQDVSWEADDSEARSRLTLRIKRYLECCGLLVEEPPNRIGRLVNTDSHQYQPIP
jgi:hypothetical protein